MAALLKRLPLLLGLGALALIASSCTMLGLNYASLEVDNKPAPKPELAARTLDQWESGTTALKSAFETHVYGPWPDGLAVSFGETRRIDDAFGMLGHVEETPITLGEGDGARTFHLAVAYPNLDVAGPLPLVISQTFSSNCSVFPNIPITAPDGSTCDGSRMDGAVGFVARTIFGEYIAEVPIEDWFRQGVVYATFYASEIVPDSASSAPDALAGLRPPSGEAPTGALMAWAYGFSAALDLLETDARVDASRTAVMGHSRHGKAALMAGVWDDRVDAVIAHQSGFGGASLSRSTTGEGVKRITKSYPHWFAPDYGSYAGRLDDLPVDQHQLLALLAPTPVFLGNGRRDVWSDPNSSFRAAQAASDVYALYGSNGLEQPGLEAFAPAADLSFFLRPGGHGVDKRDIAGFLDFLDAHFGTPQPAMSADTSIAAER